LGTVPVKEDDELDELPDPDPAAVPLFLSLEHALTTSVATNNNPTSCKLRRRLTYRTS